MFLTQSRSLRFACLTTFYVGQGIPLGLFNLALPAWMAEQGYSAPEIAGFLAIAALPWAFKLFSGPFMDRFRFPAMGQRRPWVLGALLGLLLTYALGITFLQERPEVLSLTIFAILANSFAAMQDVAVDGLAIGIVPEQERGRANSFMAFGQVAGASASGGVSGWLLKDYGLNTALTAAACVVLLVWLTALAFRERPGERMLPWTAGATAGTAVVSEKMFSIFGGLVRALTRPTSLGFIAVSAIGWAGYGMSTVFVPIVAVQRFEVASELYAQFAAYSSGGAALAVLLISPIIDRIGVRETVTLSCAAIAVLMFAAALLEPAWQLDMLVVGLVVTSLLSQFFFVGFIATHMNLTWPQIAATQFAVYMALSNLCQSGGIAVYGIMADWGDGLLVAISATCFAICALGYHLLDPKHQQQARLGAC
ncbi:MAG: MFS transporter [Pseudomonadota bacterium]